MMRNVAFLGCVFAITSLAVSAQVKTACESPSNTVEINACAKQRYDAQDRLLNRTYQALLKELSDTPIAGQSPRQLLVESQRKWLAFRDADCNAQAHLYHGGSIQTAMHLSCLRQRTEQRTKDLDPKQWQGG